MLTKKEKQATVARIGVMVLCYTLGSYIGKNADKLISKYILKEEN